jgi:hypothetical protein
MFAAEVPTEVIGGIIGLFSVVFVGLASWALHMLVKLSNVVASMEARLEEQSKDHERRIAALEASYQ